MFNQLQPIPLIHTIKYIMLDACPLIYSCLLTPAMPSITLLFAILTGSNLNMGINCEGILLIRPDDKYVIVEFPYSDVESILLDPSDDFITVNLHRNHDAQRVFVFEARWRDEMGALIASYSPEHATWIREVDNISRRVSTGRVEMGWRGGLLSTGCRGGQYQLG